MPSKPALRIRLQGIQKVPEQSASQNASYGLDCSPENVIVEPIIVPELELRNVEMQVFLADVVESSDDPALDDAPEALNRVGVHCANHVLMPSVVNGGVRKSSQ